MTLVEAAIILLTLATLTAILAPRISYFIDDAKMIKAKEEIELLGVTISRLTYDTGSPCLKKNAQKSLCSDSNRVNILYSRGPKVKHNQVNQVDFVYYELDRILLRNICGQADSAYFVDCIRANKNKLCVRKTMNWDNDDIDHGDSMESQFVINTPGYFTPIQQSFKTILGPGVGWRGSYLGSPAEKDPWGNKYLINSQFLSVPLDVEICKPDWSYNIFVISAGPNGIYETPFALRGAEARGDDIIYVF